MALEVLGSFWVFDEFQEIADLRREEFTHFMRSSEEELSTSSALIVPDERSCSSGTWTV